MSEVSSVFTHAGVVSFICDVLTIFSFLKNIDLYSQIAEHVYKTITVTYVMIISFFLICLLN